MRSKHSKSQWLKWTQNLPSALNSVGWHFDWARLAGSSSVSWAPPCVCDELPVSGTAQLLGGLWSCRPLGHLVSRPPTGQPGRLHLLAGQDPMTKSRSMQALFRPRLRIGTRFHQSAKLSHKASPDEEVNQETSSFWKAITLQRMMSTGKGIIAATFANMPHSLYK